jgi:general secretion pathway protein F
MKNGLNNRVLARFYNDMGIFVNCGLTIDRGLATMKEKKSGPFLWLLDGIQHHVCSGRHLWEAMALYPKFFDKFQVNVIKAAEESGQLVEACRGLSRYYETRHKEKKRLVAGLIYPFILLHAVILLPNLKYLVVQSTKTDYWSVVLPPILIAYSVAVFLYVLWKTVLQSGPAREKLDEFLLSIPVFGKLARGLSLARVIRALASLCRAGVEAVGAAKQAIATAGNYAVSWRLNGALDILERGGTFTDFFSFSGVLEPTHQGMLAVGEQTGTLVDSLERIVINIEETNKQRLSSSVKAVGILAYAIAAIMVAMTVIKFYTGYLVF